MVLEVLRALVRRWYVVVAGLLATGALAYGALVASPPEFHARGLVLLLPSDAAVGKGGNPFLLLSGLEQPAGILVASFSSAPARAEVQERSPTADYTIGIDDSTRGPVIAVDVTAASAAETMGTLDYLMARIPQELARLQNSVDAPLDTVIGSMTLTVDTNADVSRAATVRMVIAALVVGLVGTAAAGYAVDARIQRRRLGASETSDQDEDPGSGPDSPPQQDHTGGRRAMRASRSRRRPVAGAGVHTSVLARADAPTDASPSGSQGADEPAEVPASTELSVSTTAHDAVSVSALSGRSSAGRRT